MAYSKEHRAAVIAKMLPPAGMAIPALSRLEGISEATLYKWRSEARAQGRLAPDAGDAPAGWTSRDKFAAVVETASLNAETLAAYCRERGLYPEQIAAWRVACEQANDRAQETAVEQARLSREDRKRLRDLERELARKEKALAETAALLTLRKKAAAIWGEEDA
jgi:transposase-like protein